MLMFSFWERGGGQAFTADFAKSFLDAGPIFLLTRILPRILHVRRSRNNCSMVSQALFDLHLLFLDYYADKQALKGRTQ